MLVVPGADEGRAIEAPGTSAIALWENDHTRPVIGIQDPVGVAFYYLEDSERPHANRLEALMQVAEAYRVARIGLAKPR
jgi:hypothetical protein